jgi:hypothetical protein
MKKILAIVLALALALTLSGVALAVSTVIDFDDLTEGQFVGTHYSGLTFSPEWRAAEYDNGYNWFGYPYTTYPCVVWTGTAGFPAPYGNSGTITFDSSASSFGAYFCADYGTVYVEAYDASDTLLDSAVVPSNYGSADYASVSDSLGRIKYVLIHDTSNFWTMDSMDYDPALILDLIADGRDTAEDVGDLYVVSTGTELIITYTMTSDWEMVETHLYAGDEEPAKSSPGKFPFPNEAPDPISQTYTIAYADEGWETSDTIYIAAHAELEKEVIIDLVPTIIDETAWADGTDPIGKGANWATYFTIELN